MKNNKAPKILKIYGNPKVRPMAITHKWAVFNLETKFRLTEYTTRQLANQARMNILYDQPELRSKIGIKQKNFEN